MSQENIEIYYPDSNRIGKLCMLYETMRDPAERPMLAALHALMTIIHVEDHESGRGKVYFAASDLFQELQEGEEIPEYRIEYVYDRPFDEPDREARRIDSGKFGFVAIRKFIIRVPPIRIGHITHQVH